jgi:hypothetical protein
LKIYPWIKEFGISYHVGIDGISLFLFLLTSFLTVISILASWNIKDRIKEFMIAMLVLETGMLGVFISLDLVSVLCVLGVYADPNVPDNWSMGWPQKDLCNNKVFSIYNGGKRINAGCHHCNLLYKSQGNG